jgi:hypothetical protein
MVSEHQELIGIMNILQTRCIILDSNPFMTITNTYVSMLTTLRLQCVNLKCLLMPSSTSTVTSSSKGVGPMSYHLGANIYRDTDGTLCFGAKSYIGRMMINYETMFGEKPKEYNLPMDKNDHPAVT